MLLNTANSKAKTDVMAEELTKRLEENFRLQEEVTSLLAQLVDVQQKVKRVRCKCMV